MAGTDRQKKKFEAFDVEETRLAALWARHCELEWGEGTPVNVAAVTKALNRYRHHRASIFAPPAGDYPAALADIPREGRAHVAWARTALRQAAKLLGVPCGV